MRVFSLLLGGLLLVACGGEAHVSDPDAGGPDTGVLTPDAGQPDAGPPDAGRPDAGPPDSGPPDAGPYDGGESFFPSATGPAAGAVLIHGGGTTAGVYGTFAALAGGFDQPVVVIPTARPDPINLAAAEGGLRAAGFTDVTAIHTRDPFVANRTIFVDPITTASAVWFGGGRQWRLADAYLGTRTQTEIEAVLARGGVVGGSSAGATISGSFLFRGDTSSNTILIGDHTVGLGFVRNVGIDQHVGERGRETDLFALVMHDATQLGIGLDEGTYAVIRENEMETFGRGTTYIHYRALWELATTDDERYLRLPPGSRYDISTLSRLE